ncbi:MAG: D-alanyl-D-alanine carboxypeptidase/D-alanyl-D-alanine-endopeptidase [Pseudomonadota bacterium]
MRRRLSRLTTRWLAAGLFCAAAGTALAQALPPAVMQALAQAQVPAQHMAVVVQPVDGGAPRLQAQADVPMNPASLMKLVTTTAALELLGPAYTWPTPVWLDGRVRNGTLDGSLVIQGTGDPKLVLERVWLLLRRVQQAGVQRIRGDIVLDRSAFATPAGRPADFDGEPLKPYNVQPDALLLNHKAVVYTFTPEPERRRARVSAEPALAGVMLPATVRLDAGPCEDWRTQLQASFEPPRVRFRGSYPAACGERQWPVAFPEADRYNARLLQALWREMGGTLRGTVRDGAAPADRAPSFVVSSPPLADVVRDINKFSNNVMAQQLFLTLGAARAGSGTPEAARQVVQQWLAERFGPAAGGTVLDNGSGLSREQRTTARLLARLLLHAYAGPTMPELMSSLPVSAQDGTLRRMQGAPGRAHLKTGSLRDVAGIAGYVLGASGKRYVLVALIHDPQAPAARGALDALVQWTYDDTPVP